MIQDSMGLFLAMSGVVGAKAKDVESALLAFVHTRNGSLRQVARSTEEANTLVLSGDDAGCSVLYPRRFLVSQMGEASQYLSAQLNAPVFAFHIHDGDLWMFVLFDKGKQVAQFNPVPEYWDDNISDQKRAYWSGDAVRIASSIPGLAPDAISPYLRHWDLDDKDRGKAFPDDQFHFHDCWQMRDFIRRIGLRFPLDDAGQALGVTYEFVVPKNSSRG
jgi:hypothetical protein